MSFLTKFPARIWSSLRSSEISCSQLFINKRFESSQITSTKSKDEEVQDVAKEPKKLKKRIAINSYSHNPPQLMEFFDDPKNWAETDVQSGRSWGLDDLRIKSNSDLHKLWYVLLKERNMLLTMQHACISEGFPMPSEERIYKVQESMENIETVVKERNKAYWQLEVSREQSGCRPWAFRKDVFGMYFWQGCKEFLIPYHMNRNFRTMRGPGYGKNVAEFMRRYKEKKMIQKRNNLMKESFLVRQILRRFPDCDLEQLQEKHPRVPVYKLKEDLDSYKDHTIINKSFTQKRH